MKISIPEGLNPVYCSKCRRFLGYENIKKGYVIIYCKNCKSWNVSVGSSTNINKVYKTIEEFIKNLTKFKENDKLSNKRPIYPNKG